MAQRLALALVVHVAMGMIAVLLVLLITRDESAMVPVLVQRLFSEPNQLTALRGEASGHAMLWCLLALAASFIMTCFWLLLAERATAMDTEGSISRGGSWALCLVVALIAAAIIGYTQIIAAAVNLTLNATTLALTGLVMLATVMAGYYLGTLFGVRRSMRPSIPLAPHF